jgi:hypothetical protein
MWEITVTKPDGDPHTLQFLAWRQRAYLGTSGLYAELRWHPGLDADHVRFGGLGQHKPKDLERLDRAVNLLRRLRRAWAVGRRTLEESPTSPWRHFAEQAAEMMRGDPNLTIRGAAIRLNLPDYERSYNPGSAKTAEERAELSAERKLRRWLKLLKKSNAANQ